jgi:two-component system NtrC family sensor kinase
MNTVVAAAIQLKEYDLRTSGIELKTQLKPDLPLVFADPNQIQQVLLNVLNNAHDAVLASDIPTREIRVATDSFDGEVIIRIEDTGPGISRTDLKKVFDPFFTTKPVGKGTGLGLSISYGIIREHRGEIQIKSPPGQGTEVIIGLTVYETAPLVVTSNVEPSRSSALLKILVVDDEREIGHILQTGLSRMGFVVDYVCSAPEALSKAALGKYDFVLTDVKMPGGSGFDMFRELCSIDSLYRDRTIFLTGDTSNPTTLQVLEDEGLAYFAKPFDFQVIEKFLRERGERERSQGYIGRQGRTN